MKNEAVKRIDRVLSKAGLPVPPIPAPYLTQLHECGEACFSTRPIDPMQMYFFDKYVAEAQTEHVSDYLAFSHAGHGVNSYAFTYQLITGPLVLMVQALVGGIYMGANEHRLLEALLKRCSALIAAVEAVAPGRLDARVGRLFVFESEMRNLLVWGWRDYPLDPSESTHEWMVKHSVQMADRERASFLEAKLPTNAALKWVQTRIFSESSVRQSRKVRTLSGSEKDEIRRRLESGNETVQSLAQEFSCSPRQVAAIKAWIRMKP